jgi:hypothetical protein
MDNSLPFFGATFEVYCGFQNLFSNLSNLKTPKNKIPMCHYLVPPPPPPLDILIIKTPMDPGTVALLGSLPFYHFILIKLNK